MIQDESWNVQLSLSHKDGKFSRPLKLCPRCADLQIDPVVNSDFDPLILSRMIEEIYPGHMCYSVADPPQDIEEGMNGTLQIQYTSDFDTNVNETFYACADIRYVRISNFATQVPCFNVSSANFTTSDDDDDDDDKDTESSTGSGQTTPTTTPIPEAARPTGLSPGATAGIVIGAVVAVAIPVGIFFGYRAYQRKKRRQMQQASTRSIKMADLNKDST